MAATSHESQGTQGSGRLRGKAAIVTGAARGIGRATAVAFAREGADVMGIDIAGPVSSTLEVAPATPGDLAETGRMVEAAGTRWRQARLDQRDLPALRAAAEEARAAFGRLDILFANAGIQAFKPILEWQDADWQDTIDVNLTGTCNAIRAAAPHLVRNGGGRIIVTSSTQGRHGTKLGAAYSASKWGIIGLMKSAALELGAHKITVNAVIPGLIDTPLTRHRQRYAQAVDDFDSKQPTAALEAEAKTRLSARSPLGVPWIEPEAIAPAIVFLASDEAYMVSGATYDVTGGDSANYTAERKGDPGIGGGPTFPRDCFASLAMTALSRSEIVPLYPLFPHCPCHGVSGTGVSGGLPSAQANRFATTHSAIARRVLTEAEPTCGRSTAFSSAISSCGTLGSFSKTSRPAAKIVFFRSASISAFSSTSEPRATLINTPSGPSASSTSALMICRVPGPPGATTIRTSEALAMSMSEA